MPFKDVIDDKAVELNKGLRAGYGKVSWKINFCNSSAPSTADSQIMCEVMDDLALHIQN